MKSVGLITEYNPFHNGHLHHLQESKRATDADIAVAVMSGHYLQRGEPALVDKWVRTEMALGAGVDVVVELPFPWACNSAPHFALGAVQSLNALGAVEALCFGSEAGDLKPLQRCADLLLDREEEVTGRTAGLLREGVNYPTARARVAAELLEDPADAAVLGSPNNILGIEYLKALRRTRSAMTPCTIPRIGAGYQDREASGVIASATGIRAMLGRGDDVSTFLPEPVYLRLKRSLAHGSRLSFAQYHRALLSHLLNGPDRFRGIYQLDPGMGKRLAESALESGSVEGLVDAAKSRHITRTRVQRMLCYVLNGAGADEMAEFLKAGPLYLRLLGSSERGRRFLARARKRRELPVVDNVSRVHARLKRFYGEGSEKHRLAERMFACDLRATRNYTLLMKRWEGRSRNRDFFEEPIRVD